MAGRPLRPATDRRLGRPLPHQLANPASAAPLARGLAVPRFHLSISCGISQSFDWLSPTRGHVPMHYSPVRHSPPGRVAPPRAAVRLACVRHAASVQSEPGSNSSIKKLRASGIAAGRRHGQRPRRLLAQSKTELLRTTLMRALDAFAFRIERPHLSAANF